MKRWLSWVCIVAATTIMPACVTVTSAAPRHPAVGKLRLGEMDEKQALAFFPADVRVERHVVDEHRTMLSLSASETHPHGLVIEAVLNRGWLELVDGRLNGYSLTSARPGGTRELLERAAGARTAGELAELLGPPDGRMRCPTRAEEDCAAGEVWRYGFERAGLEVVFGGDGAASGFKVRLASRGGLPLPEQLTLRGGRPPLVLGTPLEAVLSALGAPSNEEWNERGEHRLEYGDTRAPDYRAAIFSEPDARLAALVHRLLRVDVADGRVIGYQLLLTEPDDLGPRPDAATLAIGMSRDELVARAGPPHIEARCSDRGLVQCPTGHTALLWFATPDPRRRGMPDPVLGVELDTAGVVCAFRPMPAQPPSER